MKKIKIIIILKKSNNILFLNKIVTCWFPKKCFIVWRPPCIKLRCTREVGIAGKSVRVAQGDSKVDPSASITRWSAPNIEPFKTLLRQKIAKTKIYFSDEK